MNVLVLGGRVIGPELAQELVKAYLGATFTGEERHRRRLEKVTVLEGRLRALQGCGQSVWLDYIRRSLLTSGELTRLAAMQLKAQGYAVALNKPYAGGYITEHYGRPHKSPHVLQIEINRALYMDEQSFDRSAGFDRLCADLEAMVQALIPGIMGLAVPRAAAE